MEDLVYLDNAATAFPKPKEVYDFMYEFYRNHGVNPGRSGYDMTLETEQVVQNTRKMLTEFFNGTLPERLTFSYNASDSLNMIIHGMVREGDHVVTSMLEHNSVLRPLYHKEHDGLIEVTYVPFDSTGYVDPDDIKKAIRKNTHLVILNHGSNVIGTVQPVSEVGNICREKEIPFVIDASQTAGAIPIDIQAMNVDVVAFTGHKGLMGPTGIGGLYCAEEVDIRSTKMGGTGVRSAHPFHLEEFPYRLECGTLNVQGVAGLYAGQKWLRNQDIKKIHEREITLWDRLRKGLKDIENVTMYCANDRQNQNAVLSFNVKGWEAGDVGTMLDVDYNIACRTGLQCAPKVHQHLGTDKIHGTVRFSIGPFNTAEHIDHAIEAVREIASIKR
jgi:cysteine desulfurase family protein